MSVRIIDGDCREILPTLASDSFDCIVTSPPYWGLRDYGVEGQIGLEPTLDGYIETLAGVAGELWRVLQPTGTFWLNLGDSYSSSTKGTGGNGQTSGLMRDGRPEGARASKIDAVSRQTHSPIRMDSSLKPKDLCLVPARVAMRLQADGWWLRSEIIWAKPNPMPESVRDRPTCAHEKIWLLTKGERYFYDADAIRDNLADVSSSKLTRGNGGSIQTNGLPYAPPGQTPQKGPRAAEKQRGHSRRHDGFNDRWDAMSKEEQRAAGANARNVWSISPHPYSGAHFATMPPALADRCIKAGCPVGGHVLDPFGGAGTTGLVADRLGRNATLIELNPAYREMASDRVTCDAPLFAEIMG